MRSSTLTTLSLLLLLCFVPDSLSQSRDVKPPPVASISGRVTLKEEPLRGVLVVLVQRGAPTINGRYAPLAKAVTDEDGRFQMTNLAAGSYLVFPSAPGFVIKNEGESYEQGKPVALDEGETLEGINFALQRGAVITGRVTDFNRQPLIETRVDLVKLDDQGRPTNSYFPDYQMLQTDDRGVYRIFGLPAGRYRVSVGFAPNSNALRIGFGGGYYQRTFHPDIMDEAKAPILELSEGEEANNIDISLGRPLKSYSVKGRIIDEAGKPVPNTQYGYGTIMTVGQDSTLGSMGATSNVTNSRGEFLIEGAMPGRYAAFAMKGDDSDNYTEPTIFEINDANVAGLEVRMKRGASISGFAVLEGTSDPKVLALLQNIYINAQVTPRGLEPWRTSRPKFAADGSFRLSGLRPGKVQMAIQSNEKSISLLRIEVNGAAVKDGLEIKEGELLSGVRLVLAYGIGVIRGQIKFENGEPPENARVVASLKRAGSDGATPPLKYAQADARGRFVMEGLPTGEYEIIVQAMGGRPGESFPRGPFKQSVSVTNGVDSQVTFVIDLAAKKQDQ
jgi:protocatechuate 3,4-dioxygenase beta subunit